MDAITEPSHSLKGVGIKAKAVDKEAWDHLTPAQIVARWEPSSARRGRILIPSPDG